MAKCIVEDIQYVQGKPLNTFISTSLAHREVWALIPDNLNYHARSTVIRLPYHPLRRSIAESVIELMNSLPQLNQDVREFIEVKDGRAVCGYIVFTITKTPSITPSFLSTLSQKMAPLTEAPATLP